MPALACCTIRELSLAIATDQDSIGVPKGWGDVFAQLGFGVCTPHALLPVRAKHCQEKSVSFEDRPRDPIDRTV